MQQGSKNSKVQEDHNRTMCTSSIDNTANLYKEMGKFVTDNNIKTFLSLVKC